MIIVSGFISFLRGNSMVRLWVSLFFSLLGTVYTMSRLSGDSLLKYIFVQEGSTWFFLLGTLFFSYAIIGFSLILKLGLPPLHSWFLEIISKQKILSGWFLGPRKIVPGAFFIFLFSSVFFFLSLFSILLSNVLTLGGASFLPLIVFSGASNTLFFIFVSLVSFFYSLIFFVLYRIFMYVIILSSSLERDSSWENLSILAGLPPRLIFFLKLRSLFLGGEWSPFFFVILLVSTAPIFFSYFRVWERKFFVPGIFTRSNQPRTVSYITMFFFFVPLILILF